MKIGFVAFLGTAAVATVANADFIGWTANVRNVSGGYLINVFAVTDNSTDVILNVYGGTAGQPSAGSITTNSDCLRFTDFNSTTTFASAAEDSPRPYPVIDFMPECRGQVRGFANGIPESADRSRESQPRQRDRGDGSIESPEPNNRRIAGYNESPQPVPWRSLSLGGASEGRQPHCIPAPAEPAPAIQPTSPFTTQPPAT